MKKSISVFLAVLLILFANIPALAAYGDKNIYYCHKNNSQKIALTFDDGPHPKYTRKILDILKKYDIKATFFVIGQNIEYYPGILEEIIDEGHEIGNHTYNHKHTKQLNESDFDREVKSCDKIVEEVCNYKIKLFRPPEGFVDSKVKQVADELEYSIILWNIDTRDWAHSTPAEIERNVLTNVTAGDIILMHDYTSGKNTTIEALERIIPKLLSEGYKFVKISELIED